MTVSNQSLIIAMALVLVSGCSKNIGADEFEVSVVARDYPFLELNEIALDVRIDNATDGTLLVSNLLPDGHGIIDELSWLSATLRFPTGEYLELEVERRTSEISRYRDIWNEGDLLIRRHEILPIGEDSALVYKLIAVADDRIPISSHSTIQVVFEAPVHDLGIPAEQLERNETFSGSTIIIDQFQNHAYTRARFASAWAPLPRRREEMQ